jgi:hypothetical protein
MSPKKKSDVEESLAHYKKDAENFSKKIFKLEQEEDKR